MSYGLTGARCTIQYAYMMTPGYREAPLYRALALSHELVNVAKSGDAEKVRTLNAQRARLMREFLDGADPVVSEDRQTLEQISSLNRIALQHLARRCEQTQEPGTLTPGN